MQLGFLGINYKRAQLDVRDRISFTDEMKLRFFRKAEEAGVGQCLVLSTCNRSEVFYFFEEEWQNIRLREIYGEMFPDVNVSGYLEMLCGEEAMAYLFRVTAGLESLVLGEDQILGQVKEALEYSRAMGYGGKELNKTVQGAISCAKRVKTQLRISEKPLSVSYIGIRRLEEACGIRGKRVLVIGSGKTSVLALKYLYEYGAGEVTACSRNYAHAGRLREQFPDVAVISYEERYEAMRRCDIVVSATSSPHLVVRREVFCPTSPLAFLDLAAPRDIDAAFAADPQVCLIDLDSLREIAEENRREREHLVEEGGKLVREEVEATLLCLRQSRMDSTIESLQQRCGEIVEDGCAYLNRKMELGPREQKLLRKVLNASLQRLLREPIRELKELDTEEEQERYREFTERLFRIGQDGNRKERERT